MASHKEGFARIMGSLDPESLKYDLDTISEFSNLMRASMSRPKTTPSND
jgi:hypothetical protein